MPRGITADLSTLGKVVIVSLMYVGRVGVLAFTFTLFGGSTIDELVKKPMSEEDVAI